MTKIKKHIPRVMIAAPSSNSGKTLITCAILDLLKKRGMVPASYKCGPDYIDPMFHRKVFGIDSQNMDSFFSSPEDIIRILCETNGMSAVMEGVMGIYDGINVAGYEASCYEIAHITETPIVLVVNASGMGRSVISVIKGILSEDEYGLIRGLIFNCMSEAFYESIKPVAEHEFAEAGYDIKILGSVPKAPDIIWDSRHLGLKLPDEIEDIKEQIGRASALVEYGCDIDTLIGIMEDAMDPETDAVYEDEVPGDDAPVLAVAYDEAFCFYYGDNIKRLKKAGAKIEFFSPLHDAKIPDKASGLLIGGGYPELYLEQLSENRSMLISVKRAIDGGLPTIAECGGFMYLHESVSDKEGKEYELAGAIEGNCAYTGHLVRFGYIEVTSVNEKGDPQDGIRKHLTGMRGHEFHYYDSTDNGDICTVTKPYKGKSWKCIVDRKNCLMGFPHFYYGSSPEVVEGIVECMRKFQRGERIV